MNNIIRFIIAFGALQGFIVGLILFIRSLKSQKDQLYLSLILIGYTAILGRVLAISVYQYIEESSFVINLNFIFIISPALLLLSKESIESSIDTKNNYKHFLPFFIINSVNVVLFYAFKGSDSHHAIQLYILNINNYISLLYYTTYLYLSYKFYRKNKPSYSKFRYRLLTLLHLIFFIFLIIWLVYLLIESLYYGFNMKLMHYYPMMVLLAGTSYYLSLQVVINIRSFSNLKEVFTRKTSVLNENDSQQVLDKLTTYMQEEKAHLNEDISLTSLAEGIEINPKTLSFVINEYTDKNFNDYINALRVEEVKKRLLDNKYRNYKILSIAFDCGFNSKSTFNLAFKKVTGMSPSEYKNSFKS